MTLSIVDATAEREFVKVGKAYLCWRKLHYLNNPPRWYAPYQFTRYQLGGTFHDKPLDENILDYNGAPWYRCGVHAVNVPPRAEYIGRGERVVPALASDPVAFGYENHCLFSCPNGVNLATETVHSAVLVCRRIHHLTLAEFERVALLIAKQRIRGHRHGTSKEAAVPVVRQDVQLIMAGA